MTSSSARAVIALVAFLLAALLVGGNGDAQDSGAPEPPESSRVVLKFGAFYIRPTVYEQPCEDLDLFEVPGGEDILTDQGELDALREEFQARTKVVEAVRGKVDEVGRELQIAGSLYFRKCAQFEARIRKDEVRALHWMWSGGLHALTYAENARRDAASRWYEAYSTRFMSLDEAQQDELLDRFEERLECLVEQRRLAFERKIDMATRSAVFLREGAEALRAAKDADGNPIQPDPEAQRKIAEAADALLGDPASSRAYAWLVPELTAHVAIFRRLLDLREESVGNLDLHDGLVAAAQAAPDLHPFLALPPSPEVLEARMEILRIRARRARLVLFQKELQLESSLLRATDITTGLTALASDVWRLGTPKVGGFLRELNAWWTGASDDASALRKQAADLALTGMGLAFKTGGDAFGMSLMQPLRDSVIDELWNPQMGERFGKAETSVDRARHIYGEQRQLLASEIELIESLAFELGPGHVQGAVEVFRRGESVEDLAVQLDAGPVVVRRLLEDAYFVEGTDGGLPGILEAVCESTSHRNATLLFGAEYWAVGNAKQAYRRLNAVRGLTEEKPGERLLEKHVTRLVADSRPTEFHGETLAIFGQLMWSAGSTLWLHGIGTPWKVLRLARNRIEFADGNLADRDAYLAEIVRKQELLTELRKRLVPHFDYVLLRRTDWESWRNHQELLGFSPEYLDAWSRIREAEWERRKLRVWARYTTGEEGELDEAGDRKLASLSFFELRELARLRRDQARYRLRHLAQTVDFDRAALQAEELEGLEERVRGLHGVQQVDVDYSALATGLREQATTGEVFSVYEGLYQAFLTDTIVAGVASRFAYPIVGERELTGWESLGFVKQRFVQAMNPWYGKHQLSGAWGLLKNGMIDGVRISIAQVVAREHPWIGSERDIGAALDLIFASFDEWGERVYEGFTSGRVDLAEDRSDALARSEIWRSAQRELRKGRWTFRSDEALAVHRARALAASGEKPTSDRLALGVWESARDVARAMVSDTLEGQARDRLADDTEFRPRASAEALEDAALRSATADVLARGTADEVRAANLRDLLDPAGSAPVHTQLFRGALDIASLRRAVTSALRNDPEHAEEVLALSMALDEMRVRLLNERLEEFRASEDWSERGVRIVLQPTNGGDPEAPGLRADLEVVLVTRDEASAQEVKASLQRHFTERGYPLPSSLAEERGPLGRAAEMFRDMTGLARFGLLVPTTSSLGARIFVQDESTYRRRGLSTGRPHPVAPELGDRELVQDESVPVHGLSQEQLRLLETEHGIRMDHAANINSWIQRVVVGGASDRLGADSARPQGGLVALRAGNPGAVKHMRDPTMIAKREDCKPKTAKVGAQVGLVVNPFHEAQQAFWKTETDAARARGDEARVAELENQRRNAEATWKKHWPRMPKSLLDTAPGRAPPDQRPVGRVGYFLDTDPGRAPPEGRPVGRVGYEYTDADGVTHTFRGVHGDYDLHGVYVPGPDGMLRRVSFGTGAPDADDRVPAARRRSFNDQVNRGVPAAEYKAMGQHGGQDDWANLFKNSDPPVIVLCDPAWVERAWEVRRSSFNPLQQRPLHLRGPPVVLRDAEAMRAFYEDVMLIRWEYTDGYGDTPDRQPVRVQHRSLDGWPPNESRGGMRWKINRLSSRSDVLHGEDPREPDWIPIPTWQAYGMALDVAFQLGYLGDPRFEPAAIAGLADVGARKRRVGEALEASAPFLILLDAWLIGSQEGNVVYNLSRPGRTRATHASASPQIGVDDPTHVDLVASSERLATMLARTGPGEGGEWNTHRDLGQVLEKGGSAFFGPDDLRMLQTLLRLREVGALGGDPFAHGAFRGTDPAQTWSELRDWMLEKTVGVFARLSDSWFDDYEWMTLSGTSNDDTLIREEAVSIARLVRRALDESPLIAGPFTRPAIVRAGDWYSASWEEERLQERIRSDFLAAASERRELKHEADGLRAAVRVRFVDRIPLDAAGEEEFRKALTEALDGLGSDAVRAAAQRMDPWILLWLDLARERTGT